MGFFDLLSPLFGLLDDLLGFLPDLVRLILWGVFAGFFTMWLFKKFSNQEKIQAIKSKVKANQKKMAAFEGEASELFPLIGETLKLAFRQLGATLGPALLVSIPLIFLLAFLSNNYGLQTPQAGDSYLAEVKAGSGSFNPRLYQWQNTPRVRWGNDDQAWGFTWPDNPEPVVLKRGELTVFTGTSDRIAPLIHKKLWWNWLIGNPMGYLPADSPMETLRFNFRKNTVLEAGPDWMRGWLFTFFMSFLLFSIVFKFVLRIA